jgi:hypothetical protein
MDRHLSHALDLGRPAGAVNSLSTPLAFRRRRDLRIENSRSYVRERDAPFREKTMAERPVATGTEARAGSKEGVVRYVLLASLVLVVVLFVVAFELFS